MSETLLPVDPPADMGFNNLLQIRSGKGLNGPEWYHPERDLANRFPSWVRDALLRISNPSAPLPPEVAAETGQAAQAIARMVREIVAGKYDAKADRAKLQEDLIALRTKYPQAYYLIAGLFFETEMFRFRDWAPDVRDRAAAKTPMPAAIARDCPPAEKVNECSTGERGL